MGIQSSINSAIGSLTVAGAVKKYGEQQKELQKGQQDIKSSIDKQVKENQKEQDLVTEAQKTMGKEYEDIVSQEDSLGKEAMKTIDDYYTAQENGEMTDSQAYQKALQKYREKMQSIQQQKQGNLEWRMQLKQRRKELRDEYVSLTGGND